VLALADHQAFLLGIQFQFSIEGLAATPKTARTPETAATARIRCPESDRGSDQCSIPNAQFSSEVDAGLRNIPPMQDKIAPSDQLVLQGGSHTCGGFSFRMRIEN